MAVFDLHLGGEGWPFQCTFQQEEEEEEYLAWLFLSSLLDDRGGRRRHLVCVDLVLRESGVGNFDREEEVWWIGERKRTARTNYITYVR